MQNNLSVETEHDLWVVLHVVDALAQVYWFVFISTIFLLGSCLQIAEKLDDFLLRVVLFGGTRDVDDEVEA